MKALYAQHLITVNHYMWYKSFHTFSKANRRQEIQDQNYMTLFLSKQRDLFVLLWIITVVTVLIRLKSESKLPG